MKEPLATIVKSDDGKNVGFHIPIKPDDFGKTLADLLKTPRKVLSLHEGAFFIDKEKVSKYHHLLTQRIAEQHHSQLIEFLGCVYYDDGKSVELGSYDEFLSYSEITSSIATALDLTWSFLVQLPNFQTPQKQTIRLSFRVGRPRNKDRVKPLFSFEDIYEPRLALRYFEILHTHVTLGNDLQNMLSVEMTEGGVRENAMRKIFRNPINRYLFSIISGFCLIISSFILIQAFYDQKDLGDVIINSRKFIVEVVAATFVINLAVAALYGAIFLIGTYLTSIVLTERPSFIVLSDSARDKSAVKISLYDRRTIIKGWIFLSALAGGVVASLIASGIWSRFYG